jgi:tight adherence protein C
MSGSECLLVALVVAIALASLAGRRWALRETVRERLFAGEPSETVIAAASDPRGLERWLHLAGIRAHGAVALFLGAMALATALGVVAALAIERSGVPALATRGLLSIPGGVGNVFLPIVRFMPWGVALLVATTPWLWVRRARRARIAEIERDLPIVLEMLSTLAEAGLGFDASLARILDAQEDRALAQELRAFQAELLAGVGRVQCLRNLARRIDVTAVTILVSALVQAEQVGAGIADVLRRQSNDLRNRHRERLLVQAESLSVKLVFPLVICFLPGVFVFTLGPSFATFFKIADRALRGPQRTGP